MPEKTPISSVKGKKH